MPRLTPHQLSEKKINLLKDGMYADGGNLYLSVRRNSRSWVFRFKSPTTGKIRMLGLGSLPDVTLECARELSRQSRDMLKEELDPLQQKRIGRLEVIQNRKIFEKVAKDYVESRSKQWRGKKTRQEIESMLVKYAYPVFEGRDIQSITLEDILTLLKSIWYEKTVTGTKLQGVLDRIFKYAKARGWYYGDNPAQWNGFLENLLPKASIIARVTHRKAYPWQEINKLYKRLKDVQDIPHLATRFICLTACRSAEAREMRIEEVDFKEKVWTLPANRCKTHKEHRVPLSDEAITVILQAMGLNNGQGQFVFEYRKKPIYDKAVLVAVKDAAQDQSMTLHGFRSSFRDWGSEITDTSPEILEMALGHTIKSKVEAAYRRGDMLDKRRVLMDQWAVYCVR